MFLKDPKEMFSKGFNYGVIMRVRDPRSPLLWWEKIWEMIEKKRDQG